MSINRVVPLKIIEPPPVGPVVDAPPVLTASEHTIGFSCGNCGTILMHAEEDQVHNLRIHCLMCGAYNATE